MKILKFGGNSLSTKNQRNKVLEIIKNEVSEKLIVVVSAMGRRGFPYATDTLLSLIDDKYLTFKERGRLLSTGEIISSIVLANEIKEAGLNATSLSVLETGIKIIDQEVICVDNSYITKMTKNYDILVVPGFLALDQDGEIITLPRGGSDLSAVLLATSMGEKEVYLYKDVDGVYPLFPILNKSVKSYEYLSYEEMILLENIGYKIVQYQAIQKAKDYSVKIIIMNYLTNLKGTEIGAISENREIIGLFSTHNSIIIASYNALEILQKIKNSLKSDHIFIKEASIENNLIFLKISNSQIANARKNIINNLIS